MDKTLTWEEYLERERNRRERPNIVFLMTDQQRHDTIGAAGFPHMKTPALDRLVREGRLYRNAFSPNPICIPARHNLITGLPASVHGFADNDFQKVIPYHLPTLPRILSDSGYETRAIGKMHFRPVRRHNGFDRMELMEEVPRFREEDDYAMYLQRVGWGHVQNIHGVRNLLYMTPQRSLIPEEHHGSTWVADRSVEFIRTNRGRHPFFLWASWIAPHPPFNVPDSYADLYRGADLPAPLRSETPLAELAAENRMLGDLPTETYVRRMRELYYAAVSHVDAGVGRILTALEETGQLDNTLILFFSDHGELLGDYGLYQKWLPFDSCARIPLVMRWPGRVEAGSVSQGYADLNDVLPTVLDAAGLEYPEERELPGESLVAARPEKDRGHQYIEYSRGSRRWISIRDRRYKYNYFYGGGREELFDLESDPGEAVNLLAAGPNGAARSGSLDQGGSVEAIRTRLRAGLLEYETRWGPRDHLAGSADAAGTIGANAAGSDFVSFPPYEPRPKRNSAFPLFPSQITDPTARGGMNDLFDEIRQAVRNEPGVRLGDLDLEAWKRAGGFTDEQIAELLAGTREGSNRET